MLLELKGITKRFGSLVANDSISLKVNPGEILALLGENGAGKSTLMNVLFGMFPPDEGEILLDGKSMKFGGPREAMESGIGMVHQHFMLIPVFTVAENVALGNEPTKSIGLLDIDRARKNVLEISEEFGFDLDPDALVQDLPVGSQQRVEIVKALSRDAKVLVLDEPTAVLTPQETDELMGIMRELSSKGTSIIFITHKLREVRAVADRIVVIRLGKVVGETKPETSESELANMMVGRQIGAPLAKENVQSKEVVLSVNDIVVEDDRGQPAVRNLNFSVSAGEIFAIAGVQGNGQTELAEAIIGIRKLESGSVSYLNAEINGLSVAQRLAAGIGFIPEDRSKHGLVGSFTIEENLILNSSRSKQFYRFGIENASARRKYANRLIEEFDIRTEGSMKLARELSGGNQQKAIIARELGRDTKLIVASQPTRGVDVGAIEFIHKRLIEERNQGAAILLISSELDEIQAMADRIGVMYRGELVGIVDASTPRETIGKMMAGVRL